MMAVVAVAILRIGVKNLSVAWRLARDRMAAIALCLILIVGAVSTMFEPNVLVGSFQLTALWWAAAGCALGMWAEANEDGGAGLRIGRRRVRRLKALCILSNLRHPMQGERVVMLSRAGFEVEAQAFERGGFAGGSVPECPVEILGEVRNRAYAARAVKLLGSLRKVRAAIRRNDVVYVFGPDLGALAALAGAGLRKPMAMEVADIQPVQVGGGPRQPPRQIRRQDRGGPQPPAYAHGGRL